MRKVLRYMVKKDRLNVRVENKRKRGLKGEKEIDGKDYKKARLDFGRRTLNDKMLDTEDRDEALQMAFDSGAEESNNESGDNEGGESESIAGHI